MVAEDTREVEMGDGTTTTFRICAFVLPRREQFSSPEAAGRAKIKNQNQGIYIYRENRLIHPADWLGMFARSHTSPSSGSSSPSITLSMKHFKSILRNPEYC